MKMQPATWGALAGLAVALAILAALAVMLLNSDGANFKVLVAVWLWLLPVTGFFAGVGYGAGKVIEGVTRGKRASTEEHAHADAR